LSKSEVVKIKYDILDLIEKNGFCEYYDLIEFLKNDNIERLEIAMNNTLFFNTYLKSKRHKGLKNGIS
ncbi:Rep family protein, partial [Campylobacter concisus]